MLTQVVKHRLSNIEKAIFIHPVLTLKTCFYENKTLNSGQNIQHMTAPIKIWFPTPTRPMFTKTKIVRDFENKGLMGPVQLISRLIQTEFGKIRFGNFDAHFKSTMCQKFLLTAMRLKCVLVKYDKYGTLSIYHVCLVRQ